MSRSKSSGGSRSGSGGSASARSVEIPPEATKYTTLSSLEFLCDRPPKDKETYECVCSAASPCDESSCLNRAIFIECTKRCHLGNRCCNRRLQQRKFANVSVRPAGKKGFGLFLESGELHEGDLVGEYVGEVYDALEFERRKEEYRHKGNKHLYFMNLDADHFIDSTRKGAITRFVNHSCDPNLDLQKWTVNGEPRIGFFAKTHISADEELTIDYKYDRIDDEAHPCYCGSDNCRGELDARQEPSSGKGGVGAAERALRRLQRTLEALADATGQLEASSVLELLKLMRSTFQADHRAAILEVLGGSSDATALHTFLRFRGLQFLRIYLRDFVEAEDDRLLTLMMDVLTLLPVGTKNVVNQAAILPVLEQLQSFRDASIASKAERLVQEWSELEEVAVIEKLADAADPIEMEIPRRWLNKFRESTLRRIEQQTNARLAFTRDNQDPDFRKLKLSGTEQDIMSAQQEVEETLANAAAEEAQTEERAAEAKRVAAFAEKRAKAAESRKRRLSSEGEAAAADDEVEETLPEGWSKAFDAAANKWYYFDADRSNVRWDPPTPPTVQKAKRLNSQPDKLAISAADPSMIEAIREGLEVARTVSSARSGSAAELDPGAQRKQLKTDIAQCVGKVLKRYRQKDCTIGRISNDADYKHLCRRLTHEIMKKEEGPQVDDATRHKIKNFVKGYMKKIGPKGFSRATSSPSSPS